MMLNVESATPRRVYNRSISKCNANDVDCSDNDKDNDVDGQNNTTVMEIIFFKFDSIIDKNNNKFII